YAIGVIVSKGIFRLYWFLFSTFFLFLVSFLKTAFYYLYQSKLTISAFYIIFETTGTESAGYLSTYYDTFLILLTFLTFTVLYLTWSQLVRFYKKERRWYTVPGFNK